MKLIYQFLLFLLCLSTDCLAQQGTDAGSYLSFIGTQYEETSKDMMSYSSAVAHGKGARKVEKKRSELLLQFKESERNVRKMKPFEKSSQLRDSVASYFRLCQIVLNEDYGKILNLEDIAEQSYDAMEAYLLAKEKASEKLHEANERVSTQYEAFASQNNIKLLENNSKLNQKITAAAKVTEYYDVIYLIFFKSYKNEAYVNDGLHKGDVNAIEQTSNALLTSATEDLKKLGPIQPFEGDVSLKTACQQILNFYKKESTSIIPVLIDFQIKKDSFEKIKKAYDASRSRTKEETAAYNKAINEYNAAVNKANGAGQELNKTGKMLLDKWNQASENFLDNHTPKYR